MANLIRKRVRFHKGHGLKYESLRSKRQSRPSPVGVRDTELTASKTGLPAAAERGREVTVPGRDRRRRAAALRSPSGHEIQAGNEPNMKPPLMSINDVALLDDASVRPKCIVAEPSAVVAVFQASASSFGLEAPGNVTGVAEVIRAHGRANGQRGSDAIFIGKKCSVDFPFTMQARVLMPQRAAHYPEAACQQKSTSPSSR